MIPRYIIAAPGFKASAKRLVPLLGADDYTTAKEAWCNWKTDFFLYYSANVFEMDFGYEDLCAYQHKHKAAQRSYLHQYFKTPEDYQPHEGKYVIRPLRHYGGKDYTITEDPKECDDKHYISPLFPKRHEYRLVYAKGQLVTRVIKKHPENIGIDHPWNVHNGSKFVVVNFDINDRLRYTSVYTDAQKCPIIRNAHLVALDVMYSKINDIPSYAVLETNFSPLFTIESQRQKLKEIVSTW